MMKYLFCILLGVYLCGGFHPVSDEAAEAYRWETGSSGIIQPDQGEQPAKLPQHAEKQDYHTDNGVLHSFSFRHLPPLKLPRFHSPSVTIRLRRALQPQHPQNQWAGFSYYTNLFKYSDRYHIYSLRRILI